MTPFESTAIGLLLMNYAMGAEAMRKASDAPESILEDLMFILSYMAGGFLFAVGIISYISLILGA